MFPLITALLLAAVAPARGEATATLLDGTSVAGRVNAWNASSVTLEAAGGSREIARDELLDLRWLPDEAAESAEAPAMSVELVDGTRLTITAFAVSDRLASVTTPYADEPIVIPVERIDRVHLQASSESIDAAWQRLAEQAPAGDVLLVISREGGAIDYLNGVIGDVSADEVHFDWDGQPVPVKRTKVAALAFYHAQRPRLPEAACELTLVDGSHVAARTLKLDEDGQLVIVTPAAVRLRVPLDAVARGDFSAGKLAFLSDLTPEGVAWTPRIALPGAAELVQKAGQPRTDTSFAGSPLSLAWLDESQPTGRAVRTYGKGLAIRSRTELIYRVPAGMRRFVATAGIDPATADQGHVVLEIRADDRVLWEAEIDGKRAPVDIDVELGTARRLHFRVDYGRNLDYGDRLHLVEARLTK